jgi:hypothetical protein
MSTCLPVLRIRASEPQYSLWHRGTAGSVAGVRVRIWWLVRRVGAAIAVITLVSVGMETAAFVRAHAGASHGPSAGTRATVLRTFANSNKWYSYCDQVACVTEDVALVNFDVPESWKAMDVAVTVAFDCAMSSGDMMWLRAKVFAGQELMVTLRPGHFPFRPSGARGLSTYATTWIAHGVGVPSTHFTVELVDRPVDASGDGRAVARGERGTVTIQMVGVGS